MQKMKLQLRLSHNSKLKATVKRWVFNLLLEIQRALPILVSRDNLGALKQMRLSHWYFYGTHKKHLKGKWWRTLGIWQEHKMKANLM